MLSLGRWQSSAYRKAKSTREHRLHARKQRTVTQRQQSNREESLRQASWQQESQEHRERERTETPHVISDDGKGKNNEINYMEVNMKNQSLYYTSAEAQVFLKTNLSLFLSLIRLRRPIGGHKVFYHHWQSYIYNNRPYLQLEPSISHINGLESGLTVPSQTFEI